MRALGAVLLVMFASNSFGAQAPPPPVQPAAAVQGQTSPPPAQAGPPPSPPPTPKPPAPEAYTYDPGGRRDPFLNLLGTGVQPGTTGKKGEGGASAISVAELSVRGIMQSRGALVAMVQGPDNKTYLVHQGDKLLDGTIKTITPQGLVIMLQDNDPLSLVKQREVRKLLRGLEDAK